VSAGHSAPRYILQPFPLLAAPWQILARSSDLVADSLDMLADVLAYSVSLYAVVGRGLAEKEKAALLNGSLQLLLGVSAFLQTK